MRHKMTPGLTEIAYLISALVGIAASLRLGWKMGSGAEKAESVMSRLIALFTISLLLMVVFTMTGAFFPFMMFTSNLLAAFFLGLGAGFGVLSLLKIALLKEWVAQAKNTSKSQ